MDLDVETYIDTDMDTDMDSLIYRITLDFTRKMYGGPTSSRRNEG